MRLLLHVSRPAIKRGASWHQLSFRYVCFCPRRTAARVEPVRGGERLNAPGRNASARCCRDAHRRGCASRSPLLSLCARARDAFLGQRQPRQPRRPETRTRQLNHRFATPRPPFTRRARGGLHNDLGDPRHHRQQGAVHGGLPPLERLAAHGHHVPHLALHDELARAAPRPPLFPARTAGDACSVSLLTRPRPLPFCQVPQSRAPPRGGAVGLPREAGRPDPRPDHPPPLRPPRAHPRPRPR